MRAEFDGCAKKALDQNRGLGESFGVILLPAASCLLPAFESIPIRRSKSTSPLRGSGYGRRTALRASSSIFLCGTGQPTCVISVK